MAQRTVLVTGGSRGLGARHRRGVPRRRRPRGHVQPGARRTTDAWSADPALADRFLFEAVDLVDRDACDEFLHERRSTGSVPSMCS